MALLTAARKADPATSPPQECIRNSPGGIDGGRDAPAKATPSDMTNLTLPPALTVYSITPDDARIAMRLTPETHLRVPAVSWAAIPSPLGSSTPSEWCLKSALAIRPPS
ncbi:hypothetical protein P154DRAFT_534122 [Amniculicola lignicola CBS 123094]|uniref:Uncharacterized protein n=1 Tax=Amniculicola lignicola CBS 123094 TaxID=1392246 RepID=A0A6A5WUK0_9PLEO|nr:hypothetical protein P154DRAFT_534122 [Amniculicola lignicola CBS 123094]